MHVINLWSLCTAILGACQPILIKKICNICCLSYILSIVGLTEIKLKVDQSFLPNIEMPGYSLTFQPSL